MMEVIPIADITVGHRHRRHLGDIAKLARSIETQGLLHPVVVDDEGQLIAGMRRLEAFKALGRSEIPVHVVDLGDALARERDENTERLDFAPDELVAIGRALEDRERAAAKQRSGMRTDLRETFPEVGRVRDKVAAAAGVSGRHYEKAKAVVEAAEREPERFDDLVEEMARTRKVNGAYRKLRQRQDERRVLDLRPAAGRHRTLIIDPPWDYGAMSLAGRAAPGYATMGQDELRELPVLGWAAPDFCHLYLWTTNNFLTRACDLMAAWGFQHRTVLVWIKPRWGLGSYFRNSTELCLFGTRGTTNTRVGDIATHFEAPLAEHSAKPDIFYDIVRRASYPTIGEAFQRTARDGIANLFDEAA